MPDDNEQQSGGFLKSAPLLSAIAALVVAAVAVAGVFLPEDKPDPPPPPMLGEIVEAQAGTRNPCCTFSVQVKVNGFNNRDCLLRTTLISSADGSETPGDELTFTPEADADQARADASVSVSTAGTYTVRFVLLDPDGVELDRLETQPFPVGL